MSAICHNFVQNAWKKELCSNCFKSKDEHNQPPKPKAVYIPDTKNVEGIMKNGTLKKGKRNVAFTNELSEVIGYGGEDWSDGEEFELSEDNFDDDDFDGSDEEEKELKKLTKANTDFNTVSLNDVPDTKKSFTQLLLGKPQVDAEGKKQTLLVSVTPFGQENSSSQPKKYVKSMSHIPIAKNQKDTLAEVKSNVVLTSYTKNEDVTSKNEDVQGKEEKSLLDEISETLENGKNPIQIVPRKKTQKEIVLSIATPQSNKENIVQENNKTLSEETEKNNVKKTVAVEKKISIQRTPGIKKDQEKPTIFQSQTKIELLNSKNLKHNTSKENLSNKYIKSEFNNKIKSESTIMKEDFCKLESPKKNSILDTKETDDIILKLREEKEKSVEEQIVDIKECLEKTDITSKSEIIKEALKSKKIVETLVNTLETEHLKSKTLIVAKSENESAKIDRVINLPADFVKFHPLVIPQSRELAGEPDGRADSDENSEPPALPMSPPPVIECHSSFLHGNGTYDKPKVPTKPTTMMIRKPVPPIPNLEVNPPMAVLSTFSVEPKSPSEIVPKLVKHDSNGSDIAKIANKRKAPKPPSPESISPFARNTTNGINAESPFFRENDNSERPISCGPKFKAFANEHPHGEPLSSLPEPAPRKMLSMSTDSLPHIDDKKRDKNKVGIFLKKFWKIGSTKDLTKASSEIFKTDETDYSPHGKPRLVIIHPQELNGEKVEVVAKPDQVDYGNITFRQNEYAVPKELISSQETNAQRNSAKPPPPPRNMDDYKPSLPTPPKSQEILNRQKIYSTNHSNIKKTDTVYANIGEVRSAIVPNKPQRTASMREREAQQQKLKTTDAYEIMNIDLKKDGTTENVYDYISTSNRSSSPECDSSPSKNSPTNITSRLRPNGVSQRAESSTDVSGDYYKYQNIPRSQSLTYCGSETESEIYSPYSFCGSETEVADDENEWNGQHGAKTHKLRSRKGRSIVHKNLEDNYGAVVIANHEALAQVLENIQHSLPIQPALRGLKSASNLRWSDFSVIASVPPVAVGHRTFQQAMWGSHHVTLVITIGPLPTSSLSLGTFSLIPITEFSDLLPIKYLPHAPEDAKHLQASIAVHPWMQVHTIQTFGEFLKNKTSQSNEDSWKEAAFTLLQLINALKTLQAQGIEELPDSLTSFVLCKEMDKESHSKLYVLQGFGDDLTRTKEANKLVSLCSCASTAAKHLVINSKLTPLIQSILENEKAVSLTQVKSILEFSLWGPSDVTLGSTIRERELALQRWLDLQRATVLHGLVCTKVQLTVYEECHLLFLVRSTSKMMCDASLLLESKSAKNSITNGYK